MNILIFGIICGLFANGIALTNELQNLDCILFKSGMETLGVSISRGRYIIFVVQQFLDRFNLSKQIYFYNIFVSLIIVSICAVLIVKIFNIRDKVCSYLTVGIFTSFISVSSMLIYNYVSVVYSMAMLCAIYPLKILCSINGDEKVIKNVPKYILSLILFTISMGTYQAYVMISISLINILFIFDLIFESSNKLIDIVKKYLSIILLFFISYGLNIVLSKIFLSIFEVRFDEQTLRGAEGLVGSVVSGFSVGNIFNAYIDMITLWIRDFGYAGSINSNFLVHIVYFVTLVLTIVLFIISILKVKKNSQNHDLLKTKSEVILRPILSVAAFIFLPITFGFLEILFPDGVDSLQLQNISLLLILPIVFYDKLYGVCEMKCKLSCIFKKILVVSSISIILLYSYFANLNFKDLYDMNKIVDKEMDTLISRIVSIDGYEANMPIAIVGSIPYSFRNIDRNHHFIYRGVNMNNFATSEDLEFMLENYSRFKFRKADYVAKQKLAISTEVKDMGIYPSSNSIKIVDNYIVVKLYN